MNLIVTILESIFGSHVTVEQAAVFAIKAAPLVLGLVSGTLSQEQQLQVQEIALDIKQGKAVLS